MTREPKFIPDEAIEIKVRDITMRVRQSIVLVMLLTVRSVMMMMVRPEW